MKNLIAYVDQHNRMCAMFPAAGSPMDARNLSAEEMTTLSNKLEADLSPENLTCDGELSGIALRRKTKMLRGAQQELIELSIAKAVPLSQLRLAA